MSRLLTFCKGDLPLNHWVCQMDLSLNFNKSASSQFQGCKVNILTSIAANSIGHWLMAWIFRLVSLCSNKPLCNCPPPQQGNGVSATLVSYLKHLFPDLCNFQVPANHLLSASVMSAPAALAMAKLFWPETKKSKAKADEVYKMPKR